LIILGRRRRCRKVNSTNPTQAKVFPTKQIIPFWVVAITPVLLTLFFYLPVLNNSFVNWDDPGFIQNNLYIRHLNWTSLHWMFTTLYQGNWIPITWLSYVLDYHLGGLDPWIYHLDNLCLHVLNTGLFFLLGIKILHLSKINPGMEAEEIKRNWEIPAAFLAALLFGIHPIHVESVAWATDRKDLLCTVFFLAGLLFYLSYVSQIPTKRWKYFVVLGIFCLAFLSKSMAISFPFVLLLLDKWPLRRFNSNKSRIIIEKIPFLIPAFLLGGLTIVAQSNAGAMASFNQIPLEFRIMNAFHSLIFYLEKTIAPYGLAALYPIHLKKVISIEYMLSAFGVLLISLVCYIYRKKKPHFVTMWLFYCLTLAPTLGIVHVGSQAAADRYFYLPSVAPFLLIGIALARLFQSRLLIFSLLAIGVAASLGHATMRQIHIWRDSTSLWENVLKIDPKNNANTLTCLGDAYRVTGRWDEALNALNTANAIGPVSAYPHNGKGKIFLNKGLKDDALKEFTAAIEVDSQEGWAHSHLDVIYSRQGKINSALTERAAALSSAPDDSWSHFEYGKVYMEYGMYDPAVAQIQAALLLNPNFAEAYNCLGLIYKRQGDFEKSITAFTKASSLESRNANYMENLASAYLAAKKYKEALALYQKLSNS
jgi:protein O-mannosyl-transferase